MTVLSAEVQSLRAIRNSRARFRADMLAAARAYREKNPLEGVATLTEEEVESFLSAGMEQVIELLFVQRDLALYKDAGRIEAFLQSHNDDMSALIAELTAKKRHKADDGTSVTALRKSLFSTAHIRGLKAAAQFGGAHFSQSDLGRILTCLMSPETCRKYIETLGDCGFLVREGAGTIPILSRNIIEDLFGAHLRRIHDDIRAIGARRSAQSAGADDEEILEDG